MIVQYVKAECATFLQDLDDGFVTYVKDLLPNVIFMITLKSIQFHCASSSDAIVRGCVIPVRGLEYAVFVRTASNLAMQFDNPVRRSVKAELQKIYRQDLECMMHHLEFLRR